MIDLLDESESVVPGDKEAPHPQNDQGEALRPKPRFRAGDRVCSRASGHCGVITDELVLWIEPGPSPTGMRVEGHWNYPVAWDCELGLTIRYAEYLLAPEAVA